MRVEDVSCSVGGSADNCAKKGVGLGGHGSAAPWQRRVGQTGSACRQHADWRKQFREIAGTLQRRRHLVLGNTGRYVLTPALVVEEGEQFVFPDRSPQRCAKLISAQLWRLGFAKDVRGTLPGAVKPVGGAVNSVRPGLGGNLDYRAACASKLGRRNAGGGPEFCDVFNRWIYDQRVDHGVVVVDPIQQVVVGLRPQTIDGQ